MKIVQAVALALVLGLTGSYALAGNHGGWNSGGYGDWQKDGRDWNRDWKKDRKKGGKGECKRNSHKCNKHKKVPELDASAAGLALGLVLTCTALVRERRRRRSLGA
ncbi:MAG: hypothetical protein AAGA91_04735 [Pseudomonadota bacterium]